MKAALVVGSCLLVGPALALKDGNVWGWGRKRRCDDDYGIDIDPENPFSAEGRCQLCEGIGGYVWGDALTDFEATYCEVIATADEVEPVGVALWDGRFTVELDEIMVNECTSDIECDFPGEDSTLPHAYVRQAGHWHLDFFAEFAGDVDPQRVLIEYDYTVDVRGRGEVVVSEREVSEGVGKLDIYHYQGRPITDLEREMFVYVYDGEATFNFGDLCICLALAKAGPITPDHMLPNPALITSIDSTYPVQFWGREMLTIEYWGPDRLPYNMTVDHWVKGPHHIWVCADEDDDYYRRIVRGWQPWNALQIFQVYQPIWDSAVAKLNEGPDASGQACNTAPFPGIGCDRTEGSTEASGQAVNRKADAELRAKAEETVPRTAYKGEDFEDMATTLNVHLNELLAGTVGKQCEDYTVAELNDVMRMVHAVTDPSLQAIYEGAEDPRRLRVTTNIGLERRFLSEAQLLEEAPHVEPILRDGKCHDVVMWFIHHLSRESQQEVSALIQIPHLPRERHHVVTMASGAEQELNDDYQEAIQCTDCHVDYSDAWLDENNIPLRATVNLGSDSDDAMGSGAIAGIAVAASILVVVVGWATRQSYDRTSRGSQLVEDSTFVTEEGRSVQSLEIQSGSKFNKKKGGKSDGYNALV